MGMRSYPKQGLKNGKMHLYDKGNVCLYIYIWGSQSLVPNITFWIIPNAFIKHHLEYPIKCRKKHLKK